MLRNFLRPLFRSPLVVLDQCLPRLNCGREAVAESSRPRPSPRGLEDSATASRRFPPAGLLHHFRSARSK